MRSLKLTIAYDGTNYVGWQVQPNGRTIQETLEGAWQRVTGEQVRLVASGRTDAGVHALGQVVSVATETHLEPTVLLRALNAWLPQDIAVLRVEPAPDGFHAIRDARRKRYRYAYHDGRTRDVFARNYVWHVRQPLDVDRMHEAAQLLKGTHDFACFQTAGSPRASTVRTIYDIFVRRGAGEQYHHIDLEVEADGFLYNMVRNIAGSLMDVGRGAQNSSWLEHVLLSRDRKLAGATAPPQGLVLVQVAY